MYNRRAKCVGEPAWPSRLEALMMAFAEEAAERERDIVDVLEAFGG